MRIAFLTHQWPGARMGGIGSAVRQTAAALAGAGHDVHVFTLDLPADVRAEVPAGVHLHETPSLAERVRSGGLPAELSAALAAGGEGVYRLAIGWLLCSALLDVHRQQPFDIAEAPEVEALGLPLMLARPDPPLPVITHLHCCTAIAHLGNETPVGPEEHLIRGLEFAAIALADGRCAPTRRVVELTAGFLPLPSDVGIIPHPFTPPAEVRPPRDDGPILFFGRIERLKGVEMLAQALNLVLPKHPELTARFVGPDTATAPGGGSMVAHLKRILRPELHGRVAFPGEADSRQIQRELAECRCCVLPSLWENFSLACCEAMAAGRPVIVGEGTGSVEVIGDAGLVARRGSAEDLAEQIERIIRDEALAHDLGRRARARVETALAPGVVAAERARFYAAVIERSRNNAAERDLARLAATLPAETTAALLRAVVGLSGALSGCGGQVQLTPGGRLLRIMEDLRRRTGEPARIVLYGAGKHTVRLLSERALWEYRGHRVVGLIDDHPRFAAERSFMDLPVRSLATAAASPDGHVPVVLSTDTYEDRFWEQTEPLRRRGVEVYRLYGL